MANSDTEGQKRASKQLKGDNQETDGRGVPCNMIHPGTHGIGGARKPGSGGGINRSLKGTPQK